MLGTVGWVLGRLRFSVSTGTVDCWPAPSCWGPSPQGHLSHVQTRPFMGPLSFFLFLMCKELRVILRSPVHVEGLWVHALDFEGISFVIDFLNF